MFSCWFSGPRTDFSENSEFDWRIVPSSALRSSAFSLANACSIGLKSGE
jgi:hypothetical protein